jgi:hypothetical protein
MRVFGPPAVPPAPVGGYAHAVEVRGPARFLFISGQTVMCTHLLDERWLFEIEAIAGLEVAPEKPRIPGAYDAPGGGK